MRSLGASRLALSSISSEKLWEKSGRLSKGGSEVMRFKDRRGTQYLLAPTHEEEITTLVGSLVGSHKQLPLRVYQIGRKYRDERRPRAGLLRGREFTMKDLYTFDATETAALETYEDVRQAYSALFDELRIPYLVAEADSGNMGGNLSHEYLYPSANGEDTIMSCTNCDYASNVEVARPRARTPANLLVDQSEIGIHHSITTDRKTLINTYYFKSSKNALGNTEPNEVNLHRIKDLVPDLDPGVIQHLDLFQEYFTSFSPELGPTEYSQIINLFDSALPYSVTESSFSNHTDYAAASVFTADKRIPATSITKHPVTGEPLSLLKPRVDDPCPRCLEGKLKSTTAIEIGHTFHLGTRYTVPLGAAVFTDLQQRVPMQQGCHGIGVSRMIPAIAEALRDEKGLGWPRVVAPFEVCVISWPNSAGDAENVYDVLAGRSFVDAKGLDVLLDDRERDLVWKMKDAELIGYPIFVVLGRSWQKERKVEVQAKKGNVRTEVPLEELRGVVDDILAQL